MNRVDQSTKEIKLVNIHQVNGVVEAIEFLKNADFHWVEGLFFTAKMGRTAEFKFANKRYLLKKNDDLTYTVEELPENPLRTDMYNVG